MVVQIVKKNKTELVVNWAEEGTGFGILTLKYELGGRYTLDAEYIGIDKILQILEEVNKKAKESKK